MLDDLMIVWIGRASIYLFQKILRLEEKIDEALINTNVINQFLDQLLP